MRHAGFVYRAAINASAYSALILRIEEKAQHCGCFTCGGLHIAVVEGIGLEQCVAPAKCPYCGMYTVLPECSGFPLTQNFLTELRVYYNKMNAAWGLSYREAGAEIEPPDPAESDIREEYE